jgi:hypothetical protein
VLQSIPQVHVTLTQVLVFPSTILSRPEETIRPASHTFCELLPGGMYFSATDKNNLAKSVWRCTPMLSLFFLRFVHFVNKVCAHTHHTCTHLALYTTNYFDIRVSGSIKLFLRQTKERVLLGSLSLSVLCTGVTSYLLNERHNSRVRPVLSTESMVTSPEWGLGSL